MASSSTPERPKPPFTPLELPERPSFVERRPDGTSTHTPPRVAYHGAPPEHRDSIAERGLIAHRRGWRIGETYYDRGLAAIFVGGSTEAVEWLFLPAPPPTPAQALTGTGAGFRGTLPYDLWQVDLEGLERWVERDVVLGAGQWVMARGSLPDWWRVAYNIEPRRLRLVRRWDGRYHTAEANDERARRGMRPVKLVDGRSSAIHGREHAHRVAATGVKLAEATAGADVAVIVPFGLLHDALREHDSDDRGHGARAAAHAKRLLAGALDERQLRTLTHALEHHDEGRTSTNPTIGCCWDADRLNLCRLGIPPSPALLSTPAALRLIGWTREHLDDPEPSWQELLGLCGDQVKLALTGTADRN